MANYHRKKWPLLLVAACTLSCLVQADAGSDCTQSLGASSEAAMLVKRVSELRSELRKETDPVGKCASFIELILEYALEEGLVDGSDDSGKTLGKLIGIVESRAECFEKSFSKKSDGMRRLVTFMSECASLVQSDNIGTETQIQSPVNEQEASSPVQDDRESSERDDFVRQLVEINKELTEQLELTTSELERRLKSESLSEYEEMLKSTNQHLEQQIRSKDEKLGQNEALIKELRDKVHKLEVTFEQASTKAKAAHDANALELKNCRETLDELRANSRRRIRIGDLVAKQKEMGNELAKPK